MLRKDPKKNSIDYEKVNEGITLLNKMTSSPLSKEQNRG